MLAIENNFDGFLDYEYLIQNKLNHSYYKNTKYNISFFHEFEKYKSLKDQLPNVKNKYNRRINRFYESINEPTLFIRYISNEEKFEGVSVELLYIEKNIEKILAILKGFNKKNDIIFVANEDVLSKKIEIYNVKKDENDLVARNFINDNLDLYEKFNSIVFPKKQENIIRYLKKEKHKKSLYMRFSRKSVAVLKKCFFKEYIHEKQY